MLTQHFEARSAFAMMHTMDESRVLLRVNDALLSRVAAVYERVDVLGGRTDCALGVCCPAADVCWGERQDRHRESGSVFLPWVGVEYEVGGVCVVGLNLRIGEGDGTYWEIERKIATDQHAALAAGRMRSRGSRWASATMRDAALVLRSLEGRPLEKPAGGELARTLERTARVQAVKCSPGRGRGTPLLRMRVECPERYLRHELEALRPAVLLVYGRVAGAAVRRLGDESDVERRDRRFRRLNLRLGHGPVAVFILTHPANGGWAIDHKSLRESLTRAPLDTKRH